jgi:hypothetical protein
VIVGYEVDQAMKDMSTAERQAYSRGISLAYGAVFEAFSETAKQNGSRAEALEKIGQQWDAALAAQVVRGVL